ncbi:MAG TPA: fimbria/pilus outer membrane usher protein, partial [Burkholderiales bacterium]
AQFGKRTPVGEGWGWDVFASGQGVGTPDGYTVSPAAQYNGRYGEYRASALFGVDGLPLRETYQVSTAGALAYAGGTIRAGRPIADSFGMVHIPGVEGVRVYQNSEEVGRTDDTGVAFIPRMSSYVANQIRIDDRDVPLELSLKMTTQLVSPPLRSGSVVTFEAVRYQAVTGFLQMMSQGKAVPMEGIDVPVRRNGTVLTLSTGRGGEFYLENPPPGVYAGEVSYDERKCQVELLIPESQELMLSLGKVTCEAR